MTEPTDAAKEEGRNYFYWVSAARASAMAVGRYQHPNTRLITWHSGSSGREALVAMVRTTDLWNGDYFPRVGGGRDEDRPPNH
jgi:hypothetical protein